MAVVVVVAAVVVVGALADWCLLMFGLDFLVIHRQPANAAAVVVSPESFAEFAILFGQQRGSL